MTVDGHPVTVQSTGDRVLVDLPTVGTARRALRSVSRDRVRHLADALDDAALTVEVRVRDRPVLVLGATARPGVVSRRLGLSPAEFRLGGLIGSLAGAAGALVRPPERRW